MQNNMSLKYKYTCPSTEGELKIEQNLKLQENRVVLYIVLHVIVASSFLSSTPSKVFAEGFLSPLPSDPLPAVPLIIRTENYSALRRTGYLYFDALHFLCFALGLCANLLDKHACDARCDIEIVMNLYLVFRTMRKLHLCELIRKYY